MAKKWEKFSATASLGFIHRGHLQQGHSLMTSCLTQNGASGEESPFFEARALYSFGLIHENHGDEIK